MTAESDELLTVRDGYAAWAPLYDDDGNPLIPLEEPAVRAWLGAGRGDRVLDLGCGTGRHALSAAKAGATVVAIDGSPEMLAVAGHKAREAGLRVLWLRLDLPARLPVRPSIFDAVVLGLVAEHIQRLDLVLREVGRVLRPGGRCVLSSLHPDRLREGQRARFIDPSTGLRHPIATVPRHINDYLTTADDAGLRLDDHRSIAADEALAARLPRATRYLGRNLVWVARWSKRGGA